MTELERARLKAECWGEFWEVVAQILADDPALIVPEQEAA